MFFQHCEMTGKLSVFVGLCTHFVMIEVPCAPISANWRSCQSQFLVGLKLQFLMLSGYVAWDTCLLVALNLRRCGQNRLVHILAGEIFPIFYQCFWFKIRVDSRTTRSQHILGICSWVSHIPKFCRWTSPHLADYCPLFWLQVIYIYISICIYMIM